MPIQLDHTVTFACLFVLVSFAFLPRCMSAELSDYEKGQLAGSLVFSALAVDTYYAICIAGGYDAENHITGVGRLLKENFDLDYKTLLEDQQSTTGRNYKDEAVRMVNHAKTELGGCSSEKMKTWFAEVVERRYWQNLEVLRAIQ
ncbi:hypothetical protein [Desulfogranum marinum]|uniref:hypothetical protein n=1 Tax=Desulfogranum marinum TaxID=453220 RepID=UPI0029C6FAFD|nr:hypothetical protein [Desulfogranum marinum]